jgi:predicted nucleic acid-binding protein
VVIADTSVWIPFFNRPHSLEKQVIDTLIDSDELAMTGIVLAEILQGCRTQKESDTIKNVLLALPYFEMTHSTWIKAGAISSLLLRRGVTLPMPDVIVAAIGMEYDCQVYSLDNHFHEIPSLKRYMPYGK